MATTTLSKGIQYWDDKDAYGDEDRAVRRLLNAYAREDFANNPVTTTGLTYGYRQGVAYNGTFSIAPAGTVNLVDDATNYIERTIAGVVSVNQAAFTAGRLPMATAATSAGEITTITDYRAADALIAGAVTSVFGRVGAVVAQEADYSAFFAALAHTHATSDVTGLDAALADLAGDILALIASLADKVDVSGDTMTGDLTLAGAPTNDLHAATKKYVDDEVAAAGGYTDEQAQDAVGAMVDGSTIEYVDATPLLQVKDGGITPTKASAALKTFAITVTIGDGVNVISTGYAGDITVPFTGTITDWDELADAAGDIVIDSWMNATHPPVVADTMWGTKPTLAGAIQNSATGLSIAVTQGHKIRFNVDSAATVKQVTLTFLGVRS